jgi:aconitate hydratase
VADSSDPFGARQPFPAGPGRLGHLYSLPAIERLGLGAISRMPVCLRVILEAVLRNCDGRRVHEADVRRLAAWKARGPREAEIPFLVARILLQDFTGVPVLVDLAAMRSAIARLGRDPAAIEPLVPVDLVVDHSVQVDFWTREDALWLNMQKEMERNRRRYDFLKWGAQAFRGFSVVPPGIGICHQVNLEHLATCVAGRDGVYFPDTLVGTDSHTTMVNGMGVVGWGVGGIEAEAGMLGQPIYILEPDVIGVHITGELPAGATATDAVLSVTELLRKYKVVGKFVEYFGPGAESLTVPDRATIANMAPEYGATMGFFPVDEQTCRYLLDTGRTPEHVEAVRAYFRAQGMFGIPKAGAVDYTATLDFDLSTVTPSVAGPRRPQDRIELPKLKERFGTLLRTPFAAGGYGKSEEQACQRVAIRAGIDRRFPTRITLAGGGSQDPETMPKSPAPLTSEKNTNPETEIEMIQNRPTPDRVEEVPGELPRAAVELGNGSIAIAAITSCTNTSNPGVMIAAGLLAKRAVERGLHVPPAVKASVAPGSRVVTRYLDRLGLQSYLDRLGFNTVGYGCTTCIGNSGPLDPKVERAVHANDLVVAAVLSGNRNFEARIHQSIRANFLMSPPLVVAFALAGRVDVDLANEPVGTGSDGSPVYLRDLWPSTAELAEALRQATDPDEYRRLYAGFRGQNPLWDEIPAGTGTRYEWDPTSTYIQEPPYFDKFSLDPEPCREIQGARALAVFGDSVTTDHISPAGTIPADSPAGRFLLEHGVPEEEFNTYGSRRGNDRVMVRGTFANTRIKNLMLPGVEGGYTRHQPAGERLSIYDAAVRYHAAGIPLLVFAGQEYGTGSSRDWAAKGTRLLGVLAVVAQSFERIHRSNLVQMGVLPCQFREGESAATLRLDGTETFDLTGIDCDVRPRQEVTLVVRRANGETTGTRLLVRIDTPIEAEYYRNGGILPYMVRQLAKASGAA